MPVDGSDAPAMAGFLVLPSSPRTQINRGLRERIRMSCGVVPDGRLEYLGQQETPSTPFSGLGAAVPNTSDIKRRRLRLLAAPAHCRRPLLRADSVNVIHRGGGQQPLRATPERMDGGAVLNSVFSLAGGSFRHIKQEKTAGSGLPLAGCYSSPNHRPTSVVSGSTHAKPANQLYRLRIICQ